MLSIHYRASEWLQESINAAQIEREPLPGFSVTTNEFKDPTGRHGKAICRPGSSHQEIKDAQPWDGEVMWGGDNCSGMGWGRGVERQDRLKDLGTWFKMKLCLGSDFWKGNDVLLC